MKNLKRFQLLKSESDDYLTKLDLIDTHSALYYNSEKKIQITKEEREVLRVLVIGDKKPFGSRAADKKFVRRKTIVEFKSKIL